MKSLIGILSIVATTSTIVTPIAIYSSQGFKGVTRQTGSLGHQGLSLAGGGVQSNEQTQIVPQISFESLIAQVNQSYRAAQTSSQNISLPWTKQLKTIIKESEQEETNWQLLNQNWKSCQINERLMEVFCGFAYLKNGEVEYKLKVARDYDGKWNVIIVRRSGENISFWDPYSNNGQWQTRTENNFDRLSLNDLGERTDSLWQKYQNSIIFSQPRSS